MDAERRGLLVCGLAAAASISQPFQTLARTRKVKEFEPSREFRPQTVRDPWRLGKNTIVVDHDARFLYLSLGNGRARRYGVGVGKAAMAWSGEATVERKVEWPRWTPTNDMIRRDPKKYSKFIGGVAGGEDNPLGARALYLYQNGHDTLYRIHGTNAPWTVGTASSNGCIRMINDHVIDLYKRVPIGARVIVL